MPLAVRPGVKIAPLAEFGSAGILLAVGPSGVVIHSRRQSFLQSESALEFVFLLLGASGASGAGVRRSPVARSSTLRRRLAEAALVRLVAVVTLSFASAGFSFPASDIGACACHLAIDDLLIVLGFHLVCDPAVNLARDVPYSIIESLETFRKKPAL